MRNWRKFTTKAIVSAIFISGFSFIASAPAQAETCPTYDFNTLFFEDYYPGAVWTRNGVKKEITWSANTTSIETSGNNSSPVSRPFTALELSWLELAINSWDEALESISFRQVTTPTAELTIGYTTFSNTGLEAVATGIWTGWWGNDNIRYKTTIRLKDSSTFIQNKSGFIHAVQHEVGNILGLGDIRPTSTLQSVQEDPWQTPYGPLPLGNTDIGMIRQMYGESTCPSSWQNSVTVPSPTLAELVAQVAELQKSFDTAKQEISDLQDQINQVSATNDDLRKKNKALQAKLKKICSVKPKPRNC
jgi:FtsZ-binding cell division protein ZapB